MFTCDRLQTLIRDWSNAGQEICSDLSVTGQGRFRNRALFICEPLIKPLTNRRIMDSLPVHTSKGLAYDFPDLLFSGIATLRKILSLFEPFADNPCFSPVISTSAPPTICASIRPTSTLV
jgi:hypothetical protein